MPEEKEYLTQEKYNEFEAELEILKHDKRQEIASNLEYAKSLGDLSENAEYHSAREAQANLESRINNLEELLREAEVISNKSNSGVVGAGSEVTLKRKDTGEKLVYTLVGTEESDMAAGKISNKSPLGHSMVGKKKGEDFSVDTPAGKTTYTVVAIK